MASITSSSSSTHPYICAGCGKDIRNSPGRRLLYTDACQNISVVWRELFDDELIRRGLRPQAAELLNTARPSDAQTLGRLCRRCYDVLVRYKKLQDSVKANVSEAIDQLLPANSRLSCEPSLSGSESPEPNEIPHYMPPTPKRPARSTNSDKSPEVVVCSYLFEFTIQQAHILTTIIFI